jgi:TRAP-type C4-dicarboxylate transport system substrate-binding protein
MSWKGDTPMTWAVPWEYMKRLDSESNGKIQGKFVGGGDLCTSCYEEVENGVVALGDGSFETAANLYPEISLITAHYTFPTYHSSHWTIFHSYMWENFWIPFAKKYGVIPVMVESPQPKNLYIGTDFGSKLDGKITRPEQLEGRKIRISGSGAEGVGIEGLGATPTKIPWGDTIQGMKSGVVDGMIGSEAWAPWFGMGDVSDHVVKLDSVYTESVWFARVDWLKKMPQANRNILARVGKNLAQESVKAYKPWRAERLGITSSPPPEGSGLVETNTGVSLLDNGKREAFKEKMGYAQNPEMYADSFKPVFVLVNDDGIVEQMMEIADEETPSVDNFEYESWWDEHLQEM